MARAKKAKRAKRAKKPTKGALTETQALKAFHQITAHAISQSDTGASTGACVYTAGGKTYCAVLTQDYCNSLHGDWSEGEACPT